MMTQKLHGLYAIIDPSLRSDRPVEELALDCLKGGARLIQLRDKDTPFETRLKRAQKIRQLKNEYLFTFIINDDVSLAHQVDADGVHLGQTDMPVHQARQLLGKNKVIGLSTHSLNEFHEGLLQSVDYLALGAIFPTSSKPADHPVVGLSLLNQARTLTDKPLVAIGGITDRNIGQVLETGVEMVAVISSLLLSEDVEKRASLLSGFFGTSHRKTMNEK